MSAIGPEQISQSVCNALQYISYYHCPDFIEAMHQAYLHEQSPAAKDAIGQILINARLSAEGKRPICQDTGMAVVFVTCGMHVNWAHDFSLEDAINEGVRRAYTDAENPLRASIVDDPVGARKNTGDNTPAVIHMRLVPGDRISFHVAAKGFGSENKAMLGMLPPNHDVADWIVDQVAKMGAGWCPPGVLGIGIGGTAEKACLMAKASLLEHIDIQELTERGAQTAAEQLRLDIYQRVNALGIGAQGLGGLHTVLDVKVHSYPTHAGGLPVAIIPNCAATRHIAFELDNAEVAEFPIPDLTKWPHISENNSDTRRLQIDTLQRSDLTNLQLGETVLLSGRIITARDAAHKRLCSMLDNGEDIPTELQNAFIYYCGPVPKTGDEIIGPAGPTTSSRMDSHTEQLLSACKFMGMIGKGERSASVCQAIGAHKSIYFIAVGGAAYHIAQSIKHSEVIAFDDLGMEAIHAFDVKDFPVTVAVDCNGNALHEQGPQQWRQR